MEYDATEKRQCMCSKCNGKIVHRRTFTKHAKKCLGLPLPPVATPEESSIPMHYPAKTQKDTLFQQPLHHATSQTLLEAISEHLFIFATNNGMSKAALTQCLRRDKKTMPQPNILPSSYKEAVSIIQPLLIPIRRYKCCINDCKIFPLDDTTKECTVCHESLTLNNFNRCRKTFNYMPVVSRIARWFGTKNLAKLLHSNKVRTNGQLQDYTDGSIFQRHLNSGVFKDTEESNCVPLALFTDGVNPNKNTSCQKSMWPIILTWITLPPEMRYLLGPMMLVGIVPGYGRKEPKSLDPYIEVLANELLENIECKLFDQYILAPVNVKIALLQFLCDIPAFSKLLHCSGQAALRSCLYCKEVGVRNNTMAKVIHISNRQFLPMDSVHRQDISSFAEKRVVNDPKPGTYTKEEELAIRRSFDQKPNNNQKSILQKETGLKGMHPLHSLPYFDRASQMQTDGMHTISDVIGNILDIISGKNDGPKVRNCEKEFNRFEETLIPTSTHREVVERPRKKQKKNPPSTSVSSSDTQTKPTPLPDAPWSLSKQQLNIADRRAKSVRYTKGFDFTPADHFTRQWTLRTMHGKQQFVTQNVAAWCLRNLLGKKQEETLFFLFQVIKRLVKPNYDYNEIPKLVADTSLAVTLLERDFPLTLQNLTTHLLHHIPDGFTEFGPLYDRWLYPLERANSWISRQILQHGHEESTVMQTYCIYDWSVFNLLSGKVKSCFGKESSMTRMAEKIQMDLDCDDEMQSKDVSSGKDRILTMNNLSVLHNKYNEIFDCPVPLHDINPIVKMVKIIHRFDAMTKKNVFFSTSDNQHSSSRSCDFIVCLNHDSDLIFGKIRHIYKHSHLDTDFTWAEIDIFSNPINDNNFWYAEDETTLSKLCFF